MAASKSSIKPSESRLLKTAARKAVSNLIYLCHLTARLPVLPPHSCHVSLDIINVLVATLITTIATDFMVSLRGKACSTHLAVVSILISGFKLATSTFVLSILDVY